MPELPDVAGFVSYLKSTSLHQTIDYSSVSDKRILAGITLQKLTSRLKGSAFASASRHGKFLFAELDRGGWLVLHFGMTGELTYFKNGEPPHTRLLVSFKNGYHLAYQSRRLLGHVSFTAERARFIDDHALGPDALDDELDADVFKERLAGRSGAIKPALMNQSIVAGIGNVYADEVLFQTGMRPTTPLDALSEYDVRSLHRTMRRVLRVAARHGARVADLPDGYLLKRRDEGVCPNCGGRLRDQKVSGRTSRFCPRCQKRKPPR